MSNAKKPEDLRSHRWYGVDDLRAFGHRSRTKQMGYSADDFAGKPVIAVVNTWSELNPCHVHFRQRAEEVKRGVWQAGGFPVELPALSLPENLMKPTTMLYRNLLAMEVEELLRSHPVDGAVLMGGCDKTTPALIMGAISMDLPAIFLPAGPMLRGNWRGENLGSGTDVRPAGSYLMEDFYYAGGIRALMNRLAELFDGSAQTVTGRPLAESFASAETYDDDVIRPRNNPISTEPALAVLRGSLAPDGAVIKPSAADPRLLKHTGPAVVFRDYNDMAARLDSDELEVTPDSVLVLQSAGPQGGPGMPEWGMLPIPKKLLKAGVRDMVRVSDGRMSGTSYGTCVLHVTPESFVGGPLALVRDGDPIRLDVAERRLDLVLDEAELARRRAAWQKPEPRYGRGYGAMFQDHIEQADSGCDFDFLARGTPVPEPEIH